MADNQNNDRNPGRDYGYRVPNPPVQQRPANDGNGGARGYRPPPPPPKPPAKQT